PGAAGALLAHTASNAPTAPASAVARGCRRPGPQARHCVRGHRREGSFASERMGELIHTCYRVLDLDRSVEFYEKLGFAELGRVPIRDEAINVFMGMPGDGARLELTCNIGRTEPYEIGTGY